MNPEQIAWARAVAEESYDGQLIRDLCNALADAWDDGSEAAAEHYAADHYSPHANGPADPPLNPYRDKP